MKLQVTFETGHPAKLSGLDGIVAPVFFDDRPLIGIAARADWRLNGFLSRLVQGGRFQSDAGEWLLVHTQGRLPYTHLFLVGMGKRSDHSRALANRLLETVASKVALAGLHAVAVDLSEVTGGLIEADEAMVVFLEALSGAYPEDVVSDPPYQPAIEVRSRNEQRLEEARRRREALRESRRKWEETYGAELRADEEEDSLVPDRDEPKPRPVAGGLPVARLEDRSPVVPSPPDPESVVDPELEDVPERTIRVVLLGATETVGLMRQRLRDLSREAAAPIDVEWSR